MHKSTYLHFHQLVVWSFTWSSLDSSWITSLSLLLASKRENLSELGGVQASLWAIDWGFGRIGRHWGICWEQPSSTSLKPAKNWAETKKNQSKDYFHLRRILYIHSQEIRYHLHEGEIPQKASSVPTLAKHIISCGQGNFQPRPYFVLWAIITESALVCENNEVIHLL